MSVSALITPSGLSTGELVSVRASARTAAQLAASARTLEWVDSVLVGKLRQRTLERYGELLSELPDGGAIGNMYSNLSSIDGSDAALIAQALIDTGAYDDAKKVLIRTFARLSSEGRKWAYENATGCCLLGTLCRRANALDIAETWYRAALRCYPIYREALIACGELCIERDPGDALDLLYRAHMMLDLPPTHFRIHDGSVLVINHGLGWVIVLYRGVYVGLHGSLLPHEIKPHHAQAALEEAGRVPGGQDELPKLQQSRPPRAESSPAPYSSVVDRDYAVVLQAVSR